MDVVFLSPHYPPEMPQFTRGLAEVGARVFGIADAPLAGLPADVRRHLHDYLQVPSIMDEDDVITRASAWLRGRAIDKVLANWEPVVMLAARMRERWGVPGMSPDAVLGFRDKRVMKERVEAAGLRTPRSARVKTAAEARAAAERIGFPLVIKPIAGAGSADTYRVEDAAEYERTLTKLLAVPEAIVEEYVEGDEFTYDTICIGGAPVYENVIQYFPKPIEARSLEWVSPAQISVADLTQPHLQGGLALGRQVLGALGMGDGFTHMEWYLTPKGEAVFGEIACRAGGARLVDMMNWTSDVDLFREWARVVCHGRFEATAPRRWNVGVVFKRARGRGLVTRIEGLADFMRVHGAHVVEEHLSRPGTPRRDWKATLLSDGHIVFRHAKWEEAKRIAWDAATMIQLYAQ
ncbi:MAG: ATP-grasp domain-containing protein [Deltaproteobacteria bacterium]|nr:ATP-grasp domain-containing protein [Deltaproteobacteria bacterium]